MTPESPWLVRPYQAGDEYALVKLFQRVFQRPLSIEHWQWKLKAQQAQPPPVENVWLAVHAGEPIFQYAGIPTRCVMNGQTVIGMVSVDTMTAPEFQRRGLLTQVGGHAYAKWRAAGIPFVLGLPNERWGSRTNALGWVELFDFQWLVRPLSLEGPLARRLHFQPLEKLAVGSAVWNAYWDSRLGRTQDIRVRTVTQAGAEFDVLWEHTCKDTFISVTHDRAWVRWRYLDAPALKYTVLLAERETEPVGFLAWRANESDGRRAGLVAQVHTRRDVPAAWTALWRAALAQMRAQQVGSILTLAPPDSHESHALKQIGFFPRHSFSFQFVPLADSLPLDKLKQPGSWNLAGGDFDVV